MPRRWSYQKNVAYSVKKRILQRFQEGKNWKETARANEIPLRTVHSLVKAPNKNENGVPINRVTRKKLFFFMQVKSYIERQIARSITLITNVPPKLSQAEHRLALMENWLNEAFAFVTVQSVFESVRHCAEHFDSVRTLNDLVGS